LGSCDGKPHNHAACAAISALDNRNDYGEARYQALGFVGDRLYCVVYVDRNEGRRIISLRKAKNREYKEYETSY